MYQKIIDHIKNEIPARAGYPYPNRDQAIQQTRDHLPKDRKEFNEVKEAIKMNGIFLSDVELSAILIGTLVFTPESGDLMLCEHPYTALTREWGVSTYSDAESWPTAKEVFPNVDDIEF